MTARSALTAVMLSHGYHRGGISPKAGLLSRAQAIGQASTTLIFAMCANQKGNQLMNKIYLGTSCSNCKHSYNWHLNNIKCQVDGCNCLQFIMKKKEGQQMKTENLFTTAEKKAAEKQLKEKAKAHLQIMIEEEALRIARSIIRSNKKEIRKLIEKEFKERLPQGVKNSIGKIHSSVQLWTTAKSMNFRTTKRKKI